MEAVSIIIASISILFCVFAFVYHVYGAFNLIKKNWFVSGKHGTFQIYFFIIFAFHTLTVIAVLSSILYKVTTNANSSSISMIQSISLLLSLSSFYIYHYFRLHILSTMISRHFGRCNKLTPCIILISLLLIVIIVSLWIISFIPKQTNTSKLVIIVIIVHVVLILIFHLMIAYRIYHLVQYFIQHRNIQIYDDRPTRISSIIPSMPIEYKYTNKQKQLLMDGWIRMNIPCNLYIPPPILNIATHYFQDLSYSVEITPPPPSKPVRRYSIDHHHNKIEIKKLAVTLKITICAIISIILFDVALLMNWMSDDIYHHNIDDLIADIVISCCLGLEIISTIFQQVYARTLQRKICGACFERLASKWFINDRIFDIRPNDGCFDGNGLVLMANGERKRICDLKVGDKVRSFPDYISEIECSISSEINREILMVKLYNYLSNTWCWITFEHPILVQNNNDFNIEVNKCNGIGHVLDTDIVNSYGLKWILPTVVYDKQYRFQSKTYNFILNRNHTLNVSGYWCCTLGHDFRGNVIEHPFWGNYNAITTFLKSNCETYPHVEFNDFHKKVA